MFRTMTDLRSSSPTLVIERLTKQDEGTYSCLASSEAGQVEERLQVMVHCTALYCTVLYCTVLYCTVLPVLTVPPVPTVGVVRGSVARPRVLRPAGQPLIILASLLQLLAASLVWGPQLEAEGGHGGGGHRGRAGARLLAWGGWDWLPSY